MSSADDVVAVVADARRQQLTVRMVGSGHAWSDVALTTGYLIPAEGLSWVRRGHTPLRAGVDDRLLVTVGSGTTLRELNIKLAGWNLALAQMGGYDGQTIGGAVSTSTHGAGRRFPPFPDYVRSVDLVDGSGRRLRIEPTDGITDRQRFASEFPEWALIQRDDDFDAVICGMGCLGLIVSLVIEVRESFELTEVRRISTWEMVRAELQGRQAYAHEHYEAYVNPYSRSGPAQNRCIVTTREENATEKGPRHRPRVPELLGKLPWITTGIMQLADRLAPNAVPVLLDWSLGAIAATYTNVSYKVFNIGSANNVRVYSSEMAVATDGDRHIEAVETVLSVTERYRRDGAIYLTSPIALRPVARSRALLSMMHGRETLMIELIQIVDTDGATELLAAFEDALDPLGVRPHWGQLNRIAPRLVKARYPRFSDWDAVRRRFDPDDLFASPFSKRVGITSRATGP